MKKEGADITGILKQAREAFKFTDNQDKEFNIIIAGKAASKQAT